MTFSTDQYTFTLEDLNQAARAILACHPDAVIARRLLREVLRVPPGDPQLLAIDNAASNSKWVRQLADAQLPDGSWGRFHSQDTKVKTAFRTTEEAIDRAFSLGLDLHGAVLERVHQYILDVLHGSARISDWAEKNAAWPLLIKIILAGRLAQMDPSDPNLGLFWVYLEDIAQAAFISGKYSLEDEATEYINNSGVHIPKGFLESQHALWVLSARPLPDQLEHQLIRWVWNKPDGIRYLGAALSDPVPRQIGYWFRSMNILSRFPSWREVAASTLNRLWQQRGEDGLWDFVRDARIADFPISESWRKVVARKQDYSTCLLVLLRKGFD